MNQYITDDVRLAGIRPLISPAILMEDYPASPEATRMVFETRHAFQDILTGKDDRLAVIVGPCSIHDTEAAVEYAGLLAQAAKKYEKELLLVMRVYFEKPRTTVGWKGLINDPFMDET